MNANQAMNRAAFVVVSWASLMLSLAEGRPFPMPLCLPIIVFAWFAKRSNRFQCSTWLAAVLGVMAFIAAFVEFSFGDIESRLLSIAHVVVYLTWIVLFLPWRTREYWLVLCLSLLQTAVGAVLTIEGWYGAMLVISLILMLWAMSVFCYRNAHSEYGQVAMSSERRGRSGSVNAFRKAGATSGGTQIDADESWLGQRFRRTLVKSVVATVLLAGTVFAMVPRVFIGNPIANVSLEAGRRKAIKLTGYTESVELGEMGTILQSNQGVLQVKLFNNQTGEQIDVEDFAIQQGMSEPLFRGTVMANYRKGRWERAESDNYIAAPKEIDPTVPSVRQEISQRRTRARLLFSMHPYSAVQIVGERMQVRVGVETGALHLPRGRRYASRYVLTLPRNPDQRFEPWPRQRRASTRRWVEQINKIMYLRVPKELTQLKSLAASVAGTLVGLEPSQETQAKRIDSYLRDPQRFNYSLTAVRMDENLDPIEDFLMNHRTGNCEFFASAMTLMLRAQKIPARVVHGFKGGHTNKIDGTFEVQQRHAHTWVEAYVDDRWQTFDPTPPAREAELRAMTRGFTSLMDLRMWLNSLWSTFVLNVSLDQQKQRFYEPARQKFKTFADAVTGKSADGWKGAIAAKTWLTVPGLVVGLIALLLVLIPFRTPLLRRLRAFFSWTRGKKQSETREHPVIAFYERFRAICKRHGFARSESQTEREFVANLASELSGSLPGDEAAFPAWLVEQFYQARFGTVRADQIDSAEINRRMSDFEVALNPAK